MLDNSCRIRDSACRASRRCVSPDVPVGCTVFLGSFEWVNVAHNQQPRVLSECGVDAICIRVEHVSNSCRIMSSPSFRAVTPLFGWYTPWSLLQRQSLEWYVQNFVTMLVPRHILICQVARSTCGRALTYHTFWF